MTTIFDVADWFLSKEPMTHKKVQKLCYYYKAWGLALYDVDLLPDATFEAWVHGPVNPSLYQKYKDMMWNDIPQTADNSSIFNEKELDILESVWLTYKDFSANELEAKTHIDMPWRNARGDLDDFAICNAVISNDDMKNFYREKYLRQQGE